MYEYFKNILEKNVCKTSGVCSIHPSINALYEVLLNEIREISYYLVKLNEFDLTNTHITQITISALSIFLVNTNFNKTKYLNLLKDLNGAKTEIKQKYIEYCSLCQIPCEIIKSAIEIQYNTSISDLIEKAQNLIANKQKNYNKEKQNMFDLIALSAKLSAINILKLQNLNFSSKEKINKYGFETLRFFSLTNGYSIRNEKIKRRIEQFCSIALEIKRELDLALEEKYGVKEKNTVSTDVQKGFGILVSGDDLNELEKVLFQIEQMPLDEEIKRKINVYTHGALFTAHFYPYFKNNKFLKGHISTDNIEYDFSTFTGSILLTQNFVQKIDNLYRGEIFSNKIISFEGVQDIISQNYEPLIKSCLKTENKLFKKGEDIVNKYDFEKIKEKFLNYNDSEIIIVIGQINKQNKEIKKIININCPLELDLLFDILEILKNKQIKITVLFAQCNLSNIETVLLMLNKKADIYLASCSNILVNPHIIEALKNEFEIKIIN